MSISFVSAIKLNDLQNLNFVETFDNNLYKYTFNGDLSKLVNKNKLEELYNIRKKIIEDNNKLINKEYINTFSMLFKNKYKNINMETIQNILNIFDGIDNETNILYNLFYKIENDFNKIYNDIDNIPKYLNIKNEYENIYIKLNKIKYLNPEFINNISTLFTNISNVIPYKDLNVIIKKFIEVEYTSNNIPRFVSDLYLNKLNTTNFNNTPIDYIQIINELISIDYSNIDPIHINSYDLIKFFNIDNENENLLIKIHKDKFTNNEYSTNVYDLYNNVSTLIPYTEINDIIKTFINTEYNNENITKETLTTYLNKINQANINNKTIDYIKIINEFIANDYLKYLNKKFSNSEENSYTYFEDFIKHCTSYINNIKICKTINKKLFYNNIDAIINENLNEFYTKMLNSVYIESILYTNNLSIHFTELFGNRIKDDKIREKIENYILTFRTLSTDEDYILFKQYLEYKNDYYEFEKIVKEKIELISLEKTTLLSNINNEIDKLLPFKCIQKNVNFIGKNYIENEYHKKIEFINSTNYNTLKDKNAFYNFRFYYGKATKLVNINPDPNGKKILEKKQVPISIKYNVKLFTINIQIISTSRIKYFEIDNFDFNIDESVLKIQNGLYKYNIPYNLFQLENTPFDTILWELGQIKHVLEFHIY